MTALKNLNSRPIEILVADDNPADARLILEGFKDTAGKHNITVVVDGQQVMDRLQTSEGHPSHDLPDLIILDLNMPKKSGHEVLEELKSNDVLRMIPVIIFTASDAQRDIAESYRLHASAYLTKPIDFGEFARMVKSIEEFWFHFVQLPELVPNGK